MIYLKHTHLCTHMHIHTHSHLSMFPQLRQLLNSNSKIEKDGLTRRWMDRYKMDDRWWYIDDRLERKRILRLLGLFQWIKGCKTAFGLSYFALQAPSSEALYWLMPWGAAPRDDSSFLADVPSFSKREKGNYGKGRKRELAEHRCNLSGINLRKE